MLGLSMAGAINRISAEYLLSDAAHLFDKMLAAGRRHKFVSFLTRHNYRLLDLGSYPSQMTCGHDVGQREVALDNIRGTEGRLNDFDDRFNPLTDRARRRWISVARANEEGMDLPPVELIQVGGIYFVRDGHHRVSVARAFGQTTIAARVIVKD